MNLSTVKYIREVSPLFKKPSLVADLPWDGVRPQSPSYSGSEDSGSPKHGSSSSSKDRKVISLKMCFISRNLTMPDLENRYAAPPCLCAGERVEFSLASSVGQIPEDLPNADSMTNTSCSVLMSALMDGWSAAWRCILRLDCLSDSGCWSFTHQTANIRWCCAAKTPPQQTPGSLPSTQTLPPCCHKSWLTSTPTWEPRRQPPHTPTSNTSAGWPSRYLKLI